MKILDFVNKTASRNLDTPDIYYTRDRTSVKTTDYYLCDQFNGQTPPPPQYYYRTAKM